MVRVCIGVGLVAFAFFGMVSVVGVRVCFQLVKLTSSVELESNVSPQASISSSHMIESTRVSSHITLWPRVIFVACSINPQLTEQKVEPRPT
jgi:hypothetical protein